MKNWLAFLFFIIGNFCRAQSPFWSENFNAAAASCNPASSPFNWTVTEIGVQGSASNYWYIDTTVDCHRPDTCYIPSTSSLNRALYISFGDTCDSALVGPVYKKGCDNTTDKRAESPTIDCSGKQNIRLEFDYMARKYWRYDYGYVMFSDDDGLSWDSISPSLVSGHCPAYGAFTGYWKHYSIQLPSSANNNPNVKIGFRWSNNDDCVGTFVSIAIDNVILFESCVAIITASDDSICPGACVDFSFSSAGVTSYSWLFPGGYPTTDTSSSPHICYSAPNSSFDASLIVNGYGCTDTITIIDFITTFPQPPPQGIMQNGDTLFAYTGAAIYQWYFNGNIISGATNYNYIISESGNYNVVATDTNGCEVEAAIFDVIKLCEARFTVSEDSICPGTCTDFTCTSIGITSFVWSFPGGNPSSATHDTTVCYNNAETSFPVTLMVYGDGCGDTLTTNNVVTTYPFPPPQGIDQVGNTLNAYTGAASYQWYYNGNLILGATSYFYNASLCGDYSVVATDIHGCEVEAVIFNVVLTGGCP